MTTCRGTFYLPENIMIFWLTSSKKIINCCILLYISFWLTSSLTLSVYVYVISFFVLWQFQPAPSGSRTCQESAIRSERHPDRLGPHQMGNGAVCVDHRTSPWQCMMWLVTSCYNVRLHKLDQKKIGHIYPYNIVNMFCDVLRVIQLVTESNVWSKMLWPV